MIRAFLAASLMVFGQQAFEVATVKTSDPNARGTSLMIQPGGKFATTNIPLRGVIAFAYDIRDFQLSGGPGWINSDRWDIAAKMGDGIAADPRSMNDDQRKAFQAQLRAMVQGLLADRFQLKVHPDSKEMPVYVLTVAKNGSKMAENTATAAGPRGIRLTGRGQVEGLGIQMDFVVQFLSNQLHRTVIDKTGLSGNYNFKLSWTPDENEVGPFGDRPRPDAPPPADPNGPSLSTAVQEQLGLKLESAKGAVKTIVIDRVEKATATAN